MFVLRFLQYARVAPFFVYLYNLLFQCQGRIPVNLCSSLMTLVDTLFAVWPRQAQSGGSPNRPRLFKVKFVPSFIPLAACARASFFRRLLSSPRPFNFAVLYCCIIFFVGFFPPRPLFVIFCISFVALTLRPCEHPFQLFRCFEKRGERAHFAPAHLSHIRNKHCIDRTRVFLG